MIDMYMYYVALLETGPDGEVVLKRQLHSARRRMMSQSSALSTRLHSSIANGENTTEKKSLLFRSTRQALNLYSEKKYKKE